MTLNTCGTKLCRRFQRLECVGASPTVRTVVYKYFVGFTDSLIFDLYLAYRPMNIQLFLRI